MTITGLDGERPSRRCRCGGRLTAVEVLDEVSGEANSGSASHKAEWHCDSCGIVEVEFSSSAWTSAEAIAIAPLTE